MNNDNEKIEELPALGPTSRDRFLASLKGFAGLAPFVGPILSEVIGQIIPDQRMDRLEAYIKKLGERLSMADEEILAKRMKRPEIIDLFEEGMFQAARSLSPERTEYIASVVFFGLAGDAREEIEAKRLLKILADLEDDQIINLASRLQKFNTDEFREKHAVVLEPVMAHMQSTQEELDRATLQEVGKQQMVRLGLLRVRFKRPKRGEMPEFDEKTGMMKAQGYEITPLGRLLLRYVGLALEGEF